MRIKIYLATYILFIAILFSSLGIVSAFMTNAQINMYTDKCIREFQTISHSLFRDISNLAGREQEISILIDGYTAYYRQHDIVLEVTYVAPSPYTRAVLAYTYRETGQYIHISGHLPDPLSHIHIDYFYNITRYIEDMSRIQNILLIVCIIFSVITAFVLYFIVAKIFKPLGIISNATRNIAGGKYSERIRIKGKGELAQVAEDFNQMAAQIQRQIHVLEKAATDKQQFIDNFAHEIRTPLTSIFGNAEYMQRALLDEGETIELTQLIMNNSTHMKQIANSLLQLATLRDYAPVIMEIPIRQLFDDIGKTMYDSLYEKGARLTYKTDIEVMQGQKDLIRSLLLNLCYNAVKACDQGQGQIELGAARYGQQIILSVRDNGHGIAPEHLHKITEPFFRVDKARSREHGGVGLGLTLCKQIADVHGAKLGVESVLGLGTKISITFTTS
ncbi:MAG: HAMP domain-containing histidine kinase [Defluviitaleaceae bacterium]|nr:HAMP domain-containing histidine kinase [Defluviitaleaceae bacterium]